MGSHLKMGGGSAPRFAPDDPSLPPPWKALVDGKTGYIYFWNTETNVTQYEKPDPAPPIPPPPPGPPPVPPKTTALSSADDQGPKHSSSKNGTPSASVSSKNGLQENMQQVLSPQPSNQYTSGSRKNDSGKFSESNHGANDHHDAHSQQYNGHASDYYSRHHRLATDKHDLQLEDRHSKQLIDQQRRVLTDHRVDRHISDDRRDGRHMAEDNHSKRYMSDDHHARRHMPEEHQDDSHANKHMPEDHQPMRYSSDNHHAVRYMEDDYHSVKHSSDDHQSSRRGQDYLDTISQSSAHGMAGGAMNINFSDGSWGGVGNRHAQSSPGASRPISSSRDIRVDTRGNIPQRGSVPKLAPIPVPQWQQDSQDSMGFTHVSEKPRQMVQSFSSSGSFKRTASDIPAGAPDLHKRPRLLLAPDASSASDVQAYRKQHEITVLGEDVPSPFMSFEAGNFPYEIQRELRNAGFISPTPIQAQSWPIALQNRDIVAIAKTGSGKTLGYLLPAFLRLIGLRLNSRSGPVVLVLAPTRELATQIEDEAKKFGRSSRITSTCVYGGAPKGPQLRDLEQGADIVIATPGRLNDFLEMKKISLRQVSYLVLDEADRMLDMGFEPQIRKIVKEVPISRQTLMFTATWPREVRKIAADLLVRPIQVNIGNSDELTANKSITQHVEIVTPFYKQRRLEEILFNQEPESKIIIFCSTKKMCDQLARNLGRSFRVASIHGDKSQAERDHVLGQFKNGRTSILVATDVAARGLDVKDIRVVINYDFPTGVEDYVHRIGRTGRAGASGVAFTFFSEQDAKYAKELVKILEGADQKVPKELYEFADRSGQLRGRGRWSADEGYPSVGQVSKEINTRGRHGLSVGQDGDVGNRTNGIPDQNRGRNARGTYIGFHETVSSTGDGIVGRNGVMHGDIGSESGTFFPRDGFRISDGWQRGEHDDDGWGRVNGPHTSVHEDCRGIGEDRIWHSVQSNHCSRARHDWHGEHSAGGRHFGRKTGWTDLPYNDGFGAPSGGRVSSGFTDKQPEQRGRVFDRLGDRHRDKLLNDRIFTEGYRSQLLPREVGFSAKKGFGTGRSHNWSWSQSPGKGWEGGQNHNPSNQFLGQRYHSPPRGWVRSRSRSPGKGWGRSHSRSPGKGWGRTCSRSPAKGLGKSRSPGKYWGKCQSPNRGWGRSHSPDKSCGRSPGRGWGRSHSPHKGCGRSPGKVWGKSCSPKKGWGRSRSRSPVKGLGKSRSPKKGWRRNHSRSPGKGWGRSRSPDGGWGYSCSRSPGKGWGKSRSPDGGWGRSSNVSHGKPCANQNCSPKEISQGTEMGNQSLKNTVSASGHHQTMEPSQEVQHKARISPGDKLQGSYEHSINPISEEPQKEYEAKCSILSIDHEAKQSDRTEIRPSNLTESGKTLHSTERIDCASSTEFETSICKSIFDSSKTEAAAYPESGSDQNQSIEGGSCSAAKEPNSDVKLDSKSSNMLGGDTKDSSAIPTISNNHEEG